MPKLLTPVGSYIFGELADGGQAFLDLTNDEMAAQNIGHGQIIRWNGQKLGLVGPIHSHVKAILPIDPKTLIVVGESGKFTVFASAGNSTHRITTEKGSAADRGPLRRGVLVDGIPIVVGMDRQVYRWKGPAAWETIEQGLPSSSPDVAGFEAVGGFSLSELYAGGWDGELWRFDGKSWRAVESPTSSIIINLCCAGDGNVYACGLRGLLLRGRDDRWQVVDLNGFTDDFWGIAWFKDRLYLSSMRGVYRLDGDALTLVDFGGEDVSSFYHLTASKDALWSVGPKDVLAFDGRTWTRID